MVAERTFGDNGDETSCMFPAAAKCRPADGHGSTGRAATIATNSYDQDPAGAVETNVAARCKIVVEFESISPARVSFHTRGVVRIFAIRKPVYGRQNRGQTYQIYMRRFTILRNRFPFEINELPPTSPPPPTAYPFGFLSPASPSPEVHPAVGIMRVCASSSNVSAAHPHCFRTLGVSKLRAPPSPLRGRLLSAGGVHPCRLLVLFLHPVLMPPSVSCSPSRFAPLCGSLKVPTFSLRSLNVVPSRTSVPEMNRPGFRSVLSFWRMEL